MIYTQRALQIDHELIDFNTLDTTSLFPFVIFHPEMIFYSTQILYSIISDGHIVPEFYASYSTDDIRRKLYFLDKGDYMTFSSGNYSGNQYDFSGLATDELYLTRAECFAREGKKDEALADLNLLLRNRYHAGTFADLQANSADEALDFILAERKKELLLRGVRWTDLRRLNKDPLRATALTRTLGGNSYSLPPNDLRYAFPLPDDEIRIGHLPQNPR